MKRTGWFVMAWNADQRPGRLQMRRIHGVELEDLAWLPSPIRDGITDFLEFAVVESRLYIPITPRLEAALAASGSSRVIDLCSGGGGPWKSLLNHLPSLGEGRVSVCLTDLYPNAGALERVEGLAGGRIRFRREPVNATDVPRELDGFRTMFSSFHHFSPAQAKAILADAVNKQQAIAVFESTQRHPLLLLYMLFTPLLVLLATPLIRPFRWSRIFWTYALPVIPLAVMYDGIVSCLRTYTCEELIRMASEIEQERFSWDAGIERLAGLPIGITYLIGIPDRTKKTGG